MSTQPDEMAIKNYPLMWRFIAGAVSANSGGQVNAFEAIRGTKEEWESAERQLQHICRGQWEQAMHLGAVADEGDTYLFQVPDMGDWEREFGQHGPTVKLREADQQEYVVAMPYHILTTYYY